MFHWRRMQETSAGASINNHSSFSAYLSSAASILASLSLHFPHEVRAGSRCPCRCTVDVDDHSDRGQIILFPSVSAPDLDVNVWLAQQIGCVYCVCQSQAGQRERISNACSGSSLELDVQACNYTYWSLIAGFPSKQMLHLTGQAWLRCPRQICSANTTDKSEDLNNCSAAFLSYADMQLHICSVLPSPLLTLASPHPVNQLKCCQSMLTKISFAPSPLLVLLCFCHHGLSAEHQLRQTEILQLVFTEIL